VRQAVFVSVFLLATLFGFAQTRGQRENGGSKFRGGVRAGMVVSQISGDDLSGFYQAGAYAGAFVFVPVSPSGRWLLQMEMNFIMKGSHSAPKKLDATNYGEFYNLRLFYTETPILVKYNIFRTLEIEIGPSINFLFHTIEKDHYGAFRTRPRFKIYEISGIAGISYVFKQHWGLHLRYAHSLLPVRKPTWVYNRYVPLQFNSSFALSGTYCF
jgi:hypothetical protein